MGEDNKEIKNQLEEAHEREKDLRTNIKDLTRKLDDTESKRKEEGMMWRIKEAENIQALAELRHKIAEVDIQVGGLWSRWATSNSRKEYSFDYIIIVLLFLQNGFIPHT